MAFAAACGGSTRTTTDAGGTRPDAARSDAGESDAFRDARGRDATDAARDHGAPSTTYPAFTPFMPSLRNEGGPVLVSPRIVTVTWKSDRSHATWEAFDDAIGASAYWSAVTSEYGVGSAVSGPSNHVELSTADPTWSDADVATFVQTSAGDTTTSGWPAPGPNVVYVIFLPRSTAATFTIRGAGSACGGASIIGGYHDDVSLGGSSHVAYAVVVPCPGLTTGEVTANASHQLIEAATDPYPSDRPAYSGLEGSAFLAWDYLQVRAGTEAADMCAPYPSSFFDDAALGYHVQRSWSNERAPRGHAPCVPSQSGSYFNVTPLEQEAITVDATPFLGQAHMPARGYRVPLGETRTFAVGFYSDGPTGGPWSIQALDLGDPYAGLYFNTPELSTVRLGMDVDHGQNGNVAYITVTMMSVDPTKSDLVVIESFHAGSTCLATGQCTHYMPILLSADGP
jgi:hypothetical protein